MCFDEDESKKSYIYGWVCYRLQWAAHDCITLFLIIHMNMIMQTSFSL
jgi:hypothetical protein